MKGERLGVYLCRFKIGETKDWFILTADDARDAERIFNGFGLNCEALPAVLLDETDYDKYLMLAKMRTDPRFVEAHISYNGEGDSGSVETVECLMAEGESPARWDRSFPTELDFSDEADSIVCELLRTHHPGWEIDDGSRGEIYINRDGSVRIEHADRLVHYEESETKLGWDDEIESDDDGDEVAVYDEEDAET